MAESVDAGAKPLRNADLARVLSPLLFFAAHVVYLALWSPDPFLKKWIDGSFSFFLALVLCNIIRARLVPADDPGEDRGAGSGPATGGEEGARVGDAARGEPPAR